MTVKIKFVNTSYMATIFSNNDINACELTDQKIMKTCNVPPYIY